MPKSRVRKKEDHAPGPTRPTKKHAVSPPWLVPTMLACLLIGLAWIAVYYVTGGAAPVKAMAGGNLVCGFALIVAGVVLATRWQ